MLETTHCWKSSIVGPFFHKYRWRMFNSTSVFTAFCSFECIFNASEQKTKTFFLQSIININSGNTFFYQLRQFWIRALIQKLYLRQRILRKPKASLETHRRLWPSFPLFSCRLFSVSCYLVLCACSCWHEGPGWLCSFNVWLYQSSFFRALCNQISLFCSLQHVRRIVSGSSRSVSPSVKHFGSCILLNSSPPPPVAFVPLGFVMYFGFCAQS